MLELWSNVRWSANLLLGSDTSLPVRLTRYRLRGYRCPVRILDGSSSKKISTLCVRLFLPALLITNVGSQLHADTGIRYVPVLSKRSLPCYCPVINGIDPSTVWALFYTLTSMGLGFAVTHVFKLQSWVTPALCFNNTTALPLLLIQSLQSTGILDRLLLSDSDTSSDALLRAKSYFLVNAIIGNSLTFALGPKLLDGEESPEQHESLENKNANGFGKNAHVQGEEQAHDRTQGDHNDRHQPNEETFSEQTSLLPEPVVRRGEEAENAGYQKGKKQWNKLPPWVRSLLGFGYSFLNAPLTGAVIGAILGLAPPLHRAFFNEPQQGGIFSAWLTDSVKNIRELFAALQVVVVGVKLSSSLRKIKRASKSRSKLLKATYQIF